jgi:hypothetical protein
MHAISYALREFTPKFFMGNTMKFMATRGSLQHQLSALAMGEFSNIRMRIPSTLQQAAASRTVSGGAKVWDPLGPEGMI